MYQKKQHFTPKTEVFWTLLRDNNQIMSLFPALLALVPALAAQETAGNWFVLADMQCTTTASSGELK